MKYDVVYGIIVFAHVVSAVLSIGPLVLLMPVIKRLHGVKEEIEEIYLAIIKVIIRVVMHAGHVLVFSGVLLLILGPWPWYTSWVIMTIAVMLLSGVFLAKGFTFVLRRFHDPGVDKKNILFRLNRTSWIYLGLMLIMLWLMVQKPMLW
ncbi:hypothetical protein [Sporosarcina sp. HYO08]|uniref:hypothetical protein n=1 Tax=Sporosarcina sp. HYO08 TaxID=1759557 RepID=UPI0007953F8A|nr:hypothetical protein [Sporosarcina sp. HYO08]KXH87106.1 hypothetical protein AU377_00575 [Sporosarcina sp. HYO08]